MSDALVIGAGPAGLMAAQELAAAGFDVLLVEAKPSPARKFLMAGKSGLNLTKDEPFEQFMQVYGEASVMLRPMLSEFGPDAVQAWARDLGQELFTGSTGRVFPRVMKASPLLRAWLSRMPNVTLKTRWRWLGWRGDAAVFDTPDGEQTVQARATVLALGGASWARLGSDGAWAPVLADRGVGLAPFAPSNMGMLVNWSPPMTKQFGQPLKGIALHAGGQVSRGEIVISERGLEGGGIYALSRPLREGAELTIDLLPDLSQAQIEGRLSRKRGKASLSNHLRKVLGLNSAKAAVLMEFGRPLPEGKYLAALIKSVPITHSGPRPIDEAISTAGGVTWASLTQNLMLRDVPGVFCAGEMLDWDAPTGGYLLTACLATGRWAGLGAARYLR
ncbi:TIGR03862 family flavoprotein [Actibacterium atlanticum]|nr:TIGR03862 family flavoprotein [Actibacterium atlanticum]